MMTPLKAYWMGILAKIEGLNETFNPFRNHGSQAVFHYAWARGVIA